MQKNPSMSYIPQIFNDISFVLPPRYKGLKHLGSGSYGHVLMANDSKHDTRVAIKKLQAVQDIVDIKRVLREIRLLHTLKHDNIVQLIDVIYDRTNNSEEMGTIYLVQEYYQADLHRVVRNQKDLTDDHVQFIMYQLLKGLHYMHSAGIMHRDIKPSNILASEDCKVCYCDFGLARKMEDQEELDKNNQIKFTEYVVTRYYRAPEIMVSSQIYSLPVDIWSLGCTFAEFLNGGKVQNKSYNYKVLFKGESYIQMVKMIFDTLGKPPDDELKQFITNVNAREYVDSMQVYLLSFYIKKPKPRQSLSKIIKYSNPVALDLLDKMVEINPFKRITAKEALNHPYFADIKDHSSETVAQTIAEFDFEHNNGLKMENVKELILIEINNIKASQGEATIDVHQEIIRLAQIKQKVVIKSKSLPLQKKTK